MVPRTLRLLSCAAVLTTLTLLSGPTPVAAQQQQRPNIVVIWGDDIGQSNVSAYSRGMMGYQTPNIDRLAGEGICSPTTTLSKAARLVVLRFSLASQDCEPE